MWWQGTQKWISTSRRTQNSGHIQWALACGHSTQNNVVPRGRTVFPCTGSYCVTLCREQCGTSREDDVPLERVYSLKAVESTWLLRHRLYWWSQNKRTALCRRKGHTRNKGSLRLVVAANLLLVFYRGCMSHLPYCFIPLSSQKLLRHYYHGHPSYFIWL